MSRLHALDEIDRACLEQAYRHRRGEIVALIRDQHGRKADALAYATCETLARRGLLHFHRKLRSGFQVAHVYRITAAGRAALYPETFEA